MIVSSNNAQTSSLSRKLARLFAVVILLSIVAVSSSCASFGVSKPAAAAPPPPAPATGLVSRIARIEASIGAISTGSADTATQLKQLRNELADIKVMLVNIEAQNKRIISLHQSPPASGQAQ